VKGIQWIVYLCTEIMYELVLRYIYVYMNVYVCMYVCMYVCIAGSAGDRDAPQLIIENRAVTVEFARDRDRDFDRSRDHRDPGSRHDQTSRRPVKSDWLCDTVSHYDEIR